MIEAQKHRQPRQRIRGRLTGAILAAKQPRANRVAGHQRERITAEPLDDIWREHANPK